MVRELFQMARSKKACLIFFDEVRSRNGAAFCGVRAWWLHCCQMVVAASAGNLCRATALPCCLVQVDAIGGARHDDGAGGDNEVQRTMLEIVNQLDGFDARGNIKVWRG